MNLDRLKRLTWSGGNGVPVWQLMAAGAVVWGVYSVLQVVVNGVVLDESVVPGQIIANAVEYPAGHPHDVFYRTAYSLSHFMAAGMWTVVPDASFVSAFRNWLFLFASTMAPFSVALVLTGRPYWAHGAVALVLLGAYIRFEGVYPMWVFPFYYSNGHIGLQLPLIIGALIVGRMWGVGGFLLGIMPAAHVTLSMAIWPWAFVYAFVNRRRLSREGAMARAVPGFVVGVAVSAGLAALIAILPDPTVASVPYVSGVDGSFMREQFIALTDVHRQTVPLYSMGYLTSPVAFLAIGFLLWRRCRLLGSSREEHDSVHAVLWILALGVMSLAVVYGAWMVQQVVGDLPGAVEIAMPWRFSNVVAVLLVPLGVAAIAASVRSMDSGSAGATRFIFAVVILATGLASVALPAAAAQGLAKRNLMVALWGVVFACELWLASRDRRLLVGTLVPIGLVLGVAASFGAYTKMALYAAVTTIFGFMILWAAARWRTDRFSSPALRHGWSVLLALGIVLCAIGALRDRREDELRQGTLRWDAVSTEDRALDAWLEENAAPDELILSAFYPRAEMQAKTTQPVLLELETLWIMTYMPRLAGVVGTMVRDLYGVDYNEPNSLDRACPGRGVNVWCDIWISDWETRSNADWLALKEKYDFRLVLAPSDKSLDLTTLFRGDQWTLYEIDEGHAGALLDIDVSEGVE